MRWIGNKLPLIVILGATATGKTALALEAAQRFDGEIISADSRQIYRQMDIGTAKATPAQRAAVPHHLIDIVDPDATLGAAEFQALAYAAIADIHQRGKLPLLVGGTGQYITAVIEGWSIPPVPPNPALRAQLEALAERDGQQALHARLAAADAEAAARIHPHNVRRVIRALEVYLETGTPISVLQRKQPPPYRILTLGLRLPRADLYARADARVDAMMAAGFLDEVRRLLDQGYRRDLPAMTGVGYLELSAHLLDDLPLDEAMQRTKHNTHDFIRRQEIWFRAHDHAIVWHNGDQAQYEPILAAVSGWLQE